MEGDDEQRWLLGTKAAREGAPGGEAMKDDLEMTREADALEPKPFIVKKQPAKGLKTKWQPRSEGWYVGTLGGREAFSDGSAMFVGKPPKGPVRILKDKQSFDYALRDALPEKMEPEETKPTEQVAEFYSGTVAVMLKGSVYVPVVQFHYAVEHFPFVKFFLGNGAKQQTRAVICKVGDDVVGVIMPMDPDAVRK